MIKGYQLELNFKMEQEQMRSENEDEEVTVDNVSTQHRGSKSFIEQMSRIESEQITADDIFETEEQGE
jgi:hypothetical protein